MVAATVKAVQAMSPGPKASDAATSGREQYLRALADKLLFKVEKSGDRFTLLRTVDVSRPVRHERLTPNEAEALLNMEAARPLKR